MSDDIHALSGAYAVDAVDDIERAAFERHLAVCEDCRAEVAGLRDAAHLLSSTVEETPPASLREGILAGISQVRPEPPVTATHPHRPPHPNRRTRPRLALVAAAAAAIAVIGTGVAITQPWEDDSTSQRAELSATDQVIRADDAERHTVRLPDGAKATVVRSSKLGKAVLVTEAMPAAPQGKIYQAWLQTPADDMEPAGVMASSSDQTMMLDGDANKATAVGITVEPPGGSDEPTSDPVLLIELDAGGTDGGTGSGGGSGA